MKANYELTKIGIKLKTSLLLLLLFLAAVFQLQAQSLVSDPADAHYCISSETGVVLNIVNGNMETYRLWKDGSATTITAAGGGPGSTVQFINSSLSGTWKYGLYTTIPPTTTVIVSEDLLPTAPTSASATSTVICTGSSTDLQAFGGIGTTFAWYEGGCGAPSALVATSITASSTLTVSPTVTTTYYGRWENGACFSTCVTVTITVEDLNAPTVSAAANPVCYNSTATLTLGGGTLYNVSTTGCNASPVTSTTTYTSPALLTTTTYYVTKEACGFTGGCVSLTVTVTTEQGVPTNLASDPAVLCKGGTATLTATVGSGGGILTWYDAVGGAAVATGTTFAVKPTTTTTYYAKMENAGCYSEAASITLTVNSADAPTSATASTTTEICSGTEVFLHAEGGSGTTLAWYSGSCGGTFVGTGNDPAVTPPATTTYYARYESAGCVSSTCAVVTVTVYNVTNPTNASAASGTVCTGNSTTLSVTDGSGVTFNWYTGSCGGTLVGTGTSTVSTRILTQTTSFYGRWESPACNSTCVTVTVIVTPLPTAVESITASGGIIRYCYPGSTTLTAVGGGSGGASVLYWYTANPCTNPAVPAAASGTISYYVTPATTTTYYAQWHNECGVSECASITICVDHPALSPTGATANGAWPSLTICDPTNVTLHATGGAGTYTITACTNCQTVFDVAATLTWYKNTCGVLKGPLDPNWVGEGNDLIVTPTTTTTYYAAWENSCGASCGTSVTVTVNEVNQPGPITSTEGPTICSGTPTDLECTANKVYTGTLRWYKGSCGGDLATTETTTTITVSPTVTTIYYARYENTNGGVNCYSNCESITITVIPKSVQPTSISTNDADNLICSGADVTLTANGGSGLGNENIISWYSGTCGGTPIFTSTTTTSYTVSRTVIITTPIEYYATWKTPAPCSESGCTTVTITYTPENMPVNITADPNPVCAGYSTLLEETSENTGYMLAWYSGSEPCVGSLLATNTVELTVTPTLDLTRYFARFEGGGCPAGPCSTLDVTRSPVPTTPVINTPSQVICVGTTLALTCNAGPAGTTITWYESTYPGLQCGSSDIATGTTVTVSPTVTTYYYAQMTSEHCPESLCASITITVSPQPTGQDNVLASAAICYGQTINLTATARTAGTTLAWYTTSNCTPASLVGTGSSVPVSPTVTTTYYVRTESENCTPSAVSQTTITVNPLPLDPISISITPSATICLGTAITMTPSNQPSAGSGHDSDVAKWYTGSSACGGNLIASVPYTSNGGALTVTPTLTIIYYVKWANACVPDPAVCAQLTVTVTAVPNTPVITSSPATICTGATTTITATYNTTAGSGIVLKWYLGGCGNGTAVGTGSPLVFSTATPGVYTFYAREESTSGSAGTCSPSTCASIVITVHGADPSPVVQSVDPICYDESVVLSATQATGSNGTLKWYKDLCSGTVLASGTGTVTLSISHVTMTTTYYAVSEYSCGNSTCVPVVVTVHEIPVAPVITTLNPQRICSGSELILRATNPANGVGGVIKWYRGLACGDGTSIGEGLSLTVTPTATDPHAVSTYIYWARYENACGALAACASITVNVDPENRVGTIESSAGSPICNGTPTTLWSTNDSGLDLTWYSGSVECGGAILKTSDGLVVTPTITSRYYAKLTDPYGVCGVSLCASITIVVNDIPLSPDPITGTNAICLGDPVNLQTDFTAGNGVTLAWYNDEGDFSGCGNGNVLGIQKTLVHTPTTTPVVKYYAQTLSTNCPASACVSISVTVNPNTEVPTNVSASPSYFCSGNNLTLSGSGVIPEGDDLHWYTGPNGTGTFLGAGGSIVVSPTSTTLTTIKYYVRSEIGTCPESGDASVTVTIHPLPVAPTVITSSEPLPLCNGTFTTLSANGEGETVTWYTGSSACGGYLYAVVTGTGTITVAPTLTTIFWANRSNLCGVTRCASITVTVNDRPLTPTSISGAATICKDSPTTLTATFTTGTGITLEWYKNDPDVPGNHVGSGPSISVTPDVTTTYFARTESEHCTSLAAKTVTITVSDIPTIPTSITAPVPVCSGVPTALTVGYTAGNGISVKWYDGECGGTPVGTGGTYTATVSAPSAIVYKTYFARTESMNCLSSACITTTVTVYPTPTALTSITAAANPICSNISTLLTANYSVTPAAGSVFYWYSVDPLLNPGAIAFSSGTKTVTVSPAATQKYWVRLQNPGCNGSAVSFTLTVTPIPTAPEYIQASNDPLNQTGIVYLCRGQAVTLTAIGGVGTRIDWFSGSNGCVEPLYASGVVSITVTPTEPSTKYYAHWWNECGVSSCTEMTIYLIETPADPTISITSGSNPICYGGEITLRANMSVIPAGTTIKWYKTSCGGTMVHEGQNYTLVLTQTTEFFVRAENDCSLSNCASINVVVSPLTSAPTITSANNQTLCENTPITFNATAGAGLTLNWYSACGGTTPIATNTTTLRVTPPVGTTTYYARMDSPPCAPSACASITVTVYATAVAPTYATATPNEICGETATTVLHAEGGSGVTLNWYASCGSTNILYTGNNITVTPTVSMTYYARWDNGAVCSSGCVSAAVSVFVPNVAPTSATVSDNDVCVGQTVQLSVSGGTGGWYAWYKGGCGVGTSIGRGASLTVTPTLGRNDYYVRYENTSCEASACKSVTVTAYSVPVAPTTVSADPTTVCVGATTVLTANGSGDELKWYSGSCAGTYVGSGSPLTVTVTGLTTYYAKWTNPVCESSCKSVTVATYPAIVAPDAHAVDPDICIGESTTLIAENGSGDVIIWYTSPSGGTPLATNVYSVIVNPVVTTSYYVRWESSHGCPPSAMTEVIVRVQTPQPVISGPQSLCQYNLVAPYFVIGAPQTGHIYVWEVNGYNQNGERLSNSTPQGPTLTNSGDGHVSIAWGTETAHGQLMVTETNEFGCSTTTEWYDVYMIRPIAPISITGPGQICQSTVQSYHTTLVPGATQYNWTVPSTWSIQAGSGTYSITVLVGTVSGDVTVAAANTCGASASISKAVIVDQVPVSPGTITGDQTPCQGETNVGYSVSAVTGITYTWTYSGNGVTFTGDGTASIVATFDNNATAGSWWVYAANSCGTGGYSTLSVTPDLLPGTIGVISGNSPVCQGVSGITYSIASIANVPSNGYTWKVPDGATISGTTTTNQIVVNFSTTAVTGNVTVFGTNACGISATASKTVTVNPLPGAAGTISGNTTPCQGAVNVSYTVPVISDATYYTWVYSGTNVTLGAQGTRTMTLTFANNATSGNLTVIGSNDCGNGTISAALAIVVSPLPGAAGTITGDSPVCQNTPHTYTVPAITNATSYFWAYDGTGATYSNTTTINQVTISFGTIATGGYLTVYGKNDCGNGVVSAAKQISVNPMPLPEVFGDVVMCAGTIDKVYYTTAIAGQTYEWRCSGGEITDGQNTPQITVDWGYGATGSVYVIATNTATGCIGQSALKVITLNPLPAPVISGATTVTAYSVQPYSTPNVAGHLYTWDVIGGEVSSGDHTSQVEITWGPMGSGTITVFETNSATGCVGQTSVPVTIGSAGTLTLSGAVTYDNVHHTGLRGVSVTLKHGATVIDSTVTGANGLYQFNSLSAGTYSVTASFSGPVGSINATDANLVQQEAVYHEEGPLAGLRLGASLVRGIGIYPTSFDAQLIMQRFVGWITTFPAGDWIFENVAVNLTTNGVQDLKGLCYGDVNGSFYPTGAKELSFLSAVDDGVITVPVNESFTYEIRSNAVADLGAMSLVMNYDQTRFNVEEVVASLNGMESKIADGQVRVAWSNTKALSLNADAPVISLQVTAKETMTQPEQIFTIGDGSEFADQSGIRINNFDLKMASVVTPENATSFFMYNYPNPFRNMTEIVYSIPEDGKVTLVMTNMYGQTIRTLVDEAKAAGTYKVKVDASDGYLTPGVYLYRIEVDGTTNSYNKTNKMMLTR